VIFRKHGYPIARCDRCRSGFLPREAVPEDLESLYSTEYFEGGRDSGYPGYVADSSILDRNFHRRLDLIGSLRPPGRLLDVGAAYGLFLKAARARGWDCIGVELAADCAREAERLAGVPVVAGDFLAVDLAKGFDVVCMFDVIEHMRDPVACLRRAASLLDRHGLLVIETGDFASPWARLLGKRWYFLDPPQHLFYFTHESLLGALEAAGFGGPTVTWRPGRWVSLSNVLFKLARNRLAPGARIPGRIYLSFGDGMLVAARKE
jgi:SAM-dependent methyltransferase